MANVPILTYHSTRTAGRAYDINDHVALERDLRTIHGMGLRIVPLATVAGWIAGRRDGADLVGAVALSFDDGARHDFVDFEHPIHGHQRSFFNILRDFRDEFGEAAQPELHATSFAIASPEARARLDVTCMRGLGWWTDDWWREANASGLMAVHNHSWDHNHPTLDTVRQRDQEKGRFDVIDTYEDCDGQVRCAADYIAHRTGSWPSLFAYPWGQSSDYMKEVYLPEYRQEHRTEAAFSVAGGYATRNSSRWDIPRFVCGSEWHDSAGLERILAGGG